jgi:hypothetical protein
MEFEVQKKTTNVSILGIKCKWNLGGEFWHRGGR